MQAFLGEAMLKKGSVLFIGESKKECFPAVARVARKHLTVHWTIIDSERLFSAVSDIIDEKRNCISCDDAEINARSHPKKKNLTHIRTDKEKETQAYSPVNISFDLQCFSFT